MREFFGFFRSRWIELLIAGVWLQSVVGAALARDWGLLAITGLGGLVVLAVIFWIAGHLQRRRVAPIGVGEAFRIPRKALIITVGMPKEPGLFAVQSQNPSHLGLICSHVTEPTAQEIMVASGLPVERTQKMIVDPWDILDVREKTETILKWLRRQGIQPQETSLDITGGTTPMSVGVFSMAEEWGMDTQYIRSKYDEKNKPIPKTQEGILVSRHPGSK